MKKTLKRLMAGALVLSMMAVPAFAAPTSVTSTEATSQELTGTTVAAPISVTISDGAKVIVNPYKLDVTIADGTVAASAGSGTSADAIISKPFYITNSGKTALEVSATVAGSSVSTDKAKAVTFATASFAASTKPVTANQVFMYVSSGLATKDDGSGDPTWGAAYDATKGDIVVSTKAAKPSVLFTLAKSMSNGQTTTNSNIGAVKLFGEANGNATTPWTAEHAVKVSFAFTVRPTTVAPTAP